MSFGKTLAAIDSGKVLVDADDLLAEMIARVQSLGGEGKLTVEVKVAYESAEDGAQRVHLSGEARAKMPMPKRHGTTLYVRADGLLSARHPRQPNLPGMEDADEVEERPVRAPAAELSERARLAVVRPESDERSAVGG